MEERRRPLLAEFNNPPSVSLPAEAARPNLAALTPLLAALAGDEHLGELVGREVETAAAAGLAGTVEGAVGAGLALEVGGVALLGVVAGVIVAAAAAEEAVKEVAVVVLLDPALARDELERQLVGREVEAAPPVRPACAVEPPVRARLAVDARLPGRQRRCRVWC